MTWNHKTLATAHLSQESRPHTDKPQLLNNHKLQLTFTNIVTTIIIFLFQAAPVYATKSFYLFHEKEDLVLLGLANTYNKWEDINNLHN